MHACMYVCMYVAGCHLDAMHDARDVRFVSGGSKSLIASGMKYSVFVRVGECALL